MTSVPLFDAASIEAAVGPQRALEVVRQAFVEHARGRWTMPPKLYLTNYPAGDFRAMPALGGGHALLKWVTSFPGNRARGLPTVSGLVVLSNAETGELEALLDAAAVTALRTGAGAVLAAETLARSEAGPAAVIGAGVNGRAVAVSFLARGRDVVLYDLDRASAEKAGAELGAHVTASAAEALSCDIVVTVTPGREPVFAEGSLAAGQHVSLMGADGPGKAEIATAELARGSQAGSPAAVRLRSDDRRQAEAARTHEPRVRLYRDDWGHAETERTPAPRMRLFCDDWGQASHGGDLAHAVEAGLIGRGDVTELGAVLIGAAPGRQHPQDVTVFDSTGLAIQDLAVAIACFERVGELNVPTVDL